MGSPRGSVRGSSRGASPSNSVSRTSAASQPRDRSGAEGVPARDAWPSSGPSIDSPSISALTDAVLTTAGSAPVPSTRSAVVNAASRASVRLRSRNRTTSMSMQRISEFRVRHAEGHEVDVDRALTALQRDGAEQRGVNRREQRGVHADDERERPDAGKGICGAADQRANGLTELEHPVSLEWRLSTNLSQIPHHDDEERSYISERVGRGALAPRVDRGAACQRERAQRVSHATGAGQWGPARERVGEFEGR